MSKKTKPAFLVFLAIVLVLTNASSVFAGPEEYRQCSDTQTCEIGEFLYDDDYTPINSATCTFNSKDPAGNTFLNNVAMTSEADGWYSYEVTTAGEAYGLYRSQICCTYLTEYICLDKSFEIASNSATLSISGNQISDAVWNANTTDYQTAGSFGANLQNPTITAADVWSSPTRSLTSFGTLVSDIWSYGSRSLNSFSSLISGIWSNSDRTLSSNSLNSGELATKSQVETVGNTVATNNTTTAADLADLESQLSEIAVQLNNNRYYLELLVNEPIIETFIEEGDDVPDLATKIKETRRIALGLSSEIGTLNQDIIALNTDWNSTNYQIALNQVSNASRVLGVSTEAGLETDNINSKISWLTQKWKSPIISNLSVQNASALSNINSITREVKSYGKTFISQQYLDIASQHIKKLGDIVGRETDTDTAETLFGYIANLEKMSDILVQQSLELDELIENWNAYSTNELDLKLNRIKDRVVAVNQIDGAEVLLKKRVNDDKHRENLALNLKGIINSNLVFLAQDADKVSQNTWLEHGSVIFRSLVTNPSDIVSQTVEVKYYLPKEIGEEHIIKIDDGLEARFDEEKDTMYVTGEVMLNPQETKTFVVEVADVWIIPEEEIESVRKQTQTLFDSLKGTSYFAQGSTIKADIDVNLDKISILQNKNQTPELKIKSHREAMLELNSAKLKLEDLKTIVSEAGSIGTVFGFVGGVQAIAVWGLIIVMVTGFVFLLIYLNTISRSGKNKKSNGGDKASKKSSSEKTTSKSQANDHQDDSSIFELIKDLIEMKYGIGNKKSAKSKRKYPIILFVLPFMLIVIVALIVYAIGSQSQSELISPAGDDFTSQFLEPSPLYQPEIGETTQEEIAQNEPTVVRESGLVLGSISDEEEPEIGSLVRVTIPSGYQAINVRTEPSPDADIAGRLYVNQNVFLLHKDDGWILMKTNNDSLEKPIVGWITENLTSEINNAQ